MLTLFIQLVNLHMRNAWGSFAVSKEIVKKKKKSGHLFTQICLNFFILWRCLAGCSCSWNWSCQVFKLKKYHNRMTLMYHVFWSNVIIFCGKHNWIKAYYWKSPPAYLSRDICAFKYVHIQDWCVVTDYKTREKQRDLWHLDKLQ